MHYNYVIVLDETKSPTFKAAWLLVSVALIDDYTGLTAIKIRGGAPVHP